MASFGYLWHNRARFPISSLKFYEAWAKRILLLPELMRKDRRYKRLIRKGAKINKMAEIGEAKIEGDLSYISIGKWSFIGRVDIALHERVTIGDNVCINDDVIILTGSHDVFHPKWPHKNAAINIDNFSWIGTGAMILPGVNIGRGAVVGARAVVSKNVEPGQIVVGNPAKPISKKRDIEFDYSPCEFLAANRAWLKG